MRLGHTLARTCSHLFTMTSPPPLFLTNTPHQHRTRTRTRTRTPIHIHTHLRTPVCVHDDLSTSPHTHIHTHARTRTHAHTYTRAHLFAFTMTSPRNPSPFSPEKEEKRASENKKEADSHRFSLPHVPMCLKSKFFVCVWVNELMRTCACPTYLPCD